MQKINKEFDRLFFLGDTHGNNMQIAGHLIKGKAERFESKAIVHVGDFGIGFETTLDEEYRKLDKLNTRLMEHNVTLYVVRGNHDDPSWFDGTPFPVSGNIIFVQDHTLLTIKLKDKDEPVKIYCNGGAVSVDRTKGTYFVDEKFTCPSETELLEIPTDLDVIVTHNRPLGCYPSVYNEAVMRWCTMDDMLDFDLRKEQTEMKRMFDSIRQRNNSRNNIQHYFGHYHWSHKERIGDMAHITLAKAELAEFNYVSKPVDQYNGKTRTGGLSPDTGPRA
jgi:predicted phosphodiesterase|tara:strand:+ start:283 stop:1113 length:831 start_codon:yes stop_codon:yes gene_type:complete